MLALSFSRPWDYAILYCGKNVENRKWPTRFQGRICVHRAKSWDEDGFQWMCQHREDLDISYESLQLMRDSRLTAVSGLVGEVDITGCMKKKIDYTGIPGGPGSGFGYGIPSVGDIGREMEIMKKDCPAYFSPWFFGPFGFTLANPTAYREVIPCRGALRLWTVPKALTGGGIIKLDSTPD